MKPLHELADDVERLIEEKQALKIVHNRQMYDAEQKIMEASKALGNGLAHITYGIHPDDVCMVTYYFWANDHKNRPIREMKTEELTFVGGMAEDVDNEIMLSFRRTKPVAIRVMIRSGNLHKIAKVESAVSV